MYETMYANIVEVLLNIMMIWILLLSNLDHAWERTVIFKLCEWIVIIKQDKP